MAQKIFTIKDIQGRALKINSPDGSMPSEQEIDKMFSIKYGNISQVREKEGIGQMLSRNLKLGLQDVYREGISPFVAGSSTLAAGIPRETARAQGVENLIYPEQQTAIGKVNRIIAEGIGLTAGAGARGAKLAFKGAQKIIPKIAGKGIIPVAARLGRNVVSGVAGGGVYGLIQQPPEDKTRLQQAGEFATIGGALPVAGAILRKGGETISGAGRFVAKHFGGVADATIKTIKRLGADRVFDPLKSQVDYISSNIVPRVKNRVIDLITDFNPKSKFILRQVGMTPDEIEILRTVDKSKLEKLRNVLGNDWSAIKSGLEGIKEQADLQFKTTLKRNPESLISPKETFYKLQGLLRKQGWIDYSGNEIQGAGIANKTKTNLIKIYQDLKRGLITQGKQRVTGQIKIIEYFNKLSELESSISGNPKFDRLVFDIQDSLRNDASKTIKGLVSANKTYSDAIRLLDMEETFSKISNPIKWQTELNKLRDIRQAQTHIKYKGILGQDIYDDVLAHLANQDFELTSQIPGAAGGSPVSRSKLLQKGVTGLTKKYYQNIQPKTQALQSGLKQALDRVISMQQKP